MLWVALSTSGVPVFFELPHLEVAAFLRRLEDMPFSMEGAPFTLQYHNGPLPNPPLPGEAGSAPKAGA